MCLKCLELWALLQSAEQSLNDTAIRLGNDTAIRLGNRAERHDLPQHMETMLNAIRMSLHGIMFTMHAVILMHKGCAKH